MTSEQLVLVCAEASPAMKTMIANVQEMNPDKQTLVVFMFDALFKWSLALQNFPERPRRRKYISSP
jgi:hypothetical protein